MREIVYGLDLDALKPGSTIEHMGRKGTVVMVDTQLPDPVTGGPVVLVNWDEAPADTPMINPEWQWIAERMEAIPGPCYDRRPLMYRWDDWLCQSVPFVGWCDKHGQERSVCNFYRRATKDADKA